MKRDPRHDAMPASLPALRFAAVASLLLAGVAGGAAGLVGAYGLSAAVLGPALFAAVAGLAGWGFARHYPHDRLGLCNAVTLVRAALASALVGPLLVPGVLAADAGLAWRVLAVALLALALDGVDGWLARRGGLVSGFGARFDMEVDALLGLILAVLVWQNGKAAVWVLALGAMRYGFVVAGWALPWLNAPLEPRFRRKVVCVVQIGTLVLLLAPVVVPPWSVVLAAGATGLLAWSFAVDILWLARRR